jgi:Ser/Thr protein kinase RdoA (MazF antagonist)
VIDPTAFATLDHGTQVACLRDLAIDVVSRRYGLRDPDCDLLQYENNAVFAITCAGDRFALRLSPPGSPLAATLSEMMWLAAIRRDTGLRVPSPVATTDGALVATTAPTGAAPVRLATLMRWVPGVRPTRDTAVELAPALGAVAATLHEHGASFQAPHGFVREDGGLPRLRADARAIARAADNGRVAPSIAAFVERAVARVEPAVDRMGTLPDVWGLVHGDLHADNLVVDGNAVGVIDFDDAGWGHFLYDVATVLDAMRRRVLIADVEYQAFRAAFLRAYGAVRPLPPSLDDDLATFRAIREIATLAFIASTDNAEVASWGPGRSAEIEVGLAAFLAGRSDL